MSAPVPPRSNDLTLTALLGAATDADAWRVIRETVARRLGRSRQAGADIEDVLGEVRLKLTQKLQSLRAGAGEPIENLHAYCVTTAEHICYGFLRRQFPERTRLRNRMRYALTHHPAMVLEQDPQGIWRCRAARLRVLAPPGTSRTLLDDPKEFVSRSSIDLSGPLAQVMAGLLGRCDAPIEFDRFVDVMATLLGVRDVPPSGATAGVDGSDGAGAIPDPAPGIQTVLEQRTTLLEVWQELTALPPRQRAALLLNLRDPEGGAILQLLPGTGVVSMTDIARALEMPEEELRALWEALPLDDLSIAARLGLTRQQVINLRKAGRARLARRIR
jgi:DNA-directed RNA polymerase specialized sigma24 family protein